MLDAKKDEWCVALRSGEYPQVRGMLHHNGELFCCLGVALVAVWKHTPNSLKFQQSEALGKWNGSSAVAFFIYLNDVVTLNFDEIALVIENVPESEWIHNK